MRPARWVRQRAGITAGGRVILQGDLPRPKIVHCSGCRGGRPAFDSALARQPNTWHPLARWWLAARRKLVLFAVHAAAGARVHSQSHPRPLPAHYVWPPYKIHHPLIAYGLHRRGWPGPLRSDSRRGLAHCWLSCFSKALVILLLWWPFDWFSQTSNYRPQPFNSEHIKLQCVIKCELYKINTRLSKNIWLKMDWKFMGDYLWNVDFAFSYFSYKYPIEIRCQEEEEVAVTMDVMEVVAMLECSSMCLPSLCHSIWTTASLIAAQESVLLCTLTTWAQMKSLESR